MSTDSDRKPESSQQLGAHSSVEIAGAASSERATRPEFAQRTHAPSTTRQALQPAFTVEAADAYAERIRPSWDEPSFRTLRPHQVDQRPARDLAPEIGHAGEDAAMAGAPPLLSADEADAYAARVQPSWAPPPAWSAPPSLAMMTVTTDHATAQAEPDWVEPDRTRVLRAALIVAGFAVLGAAVGALLALAPRLGGRAPAENTRVSALTAEPAGARPSIQTVPPAASSDTIRVRIAAEPARAKIVLDGVEVPNPFDSRRLKGGEHRVVIRARGRATRELTLTFEHDEQVRIALDPLVP